jgi:hypothetical protein
MNLKCWDINVPFHLLVVVRITLTRTEKRYLIQIKDAYFPNGDVGNIQNESHRINSLHLLSKPEVMKRTILIIFLAAATLASADNAAVKLRVNATCTGR